MCSRVLETSSCDRYATYRAELLFHRVPPGESLPSIKRDLRQSPGAVDSFRPGFRGSCLGASPKDAIDRISRGLVGPSSILSDDRSTVTRTVLGVQEGIQEVLRWDR
jgi:hypothetical protein